MLQSKFNFEAFLLSMLQKQVFVVNFSYGHELCDIYGTPERINARK